MDEITTSPGKSLANLADRNTDLISIGELASLLATHSGENELVWFMRLKSAGNMGELHVRHFPDGRIVGTEGTLRDQAGGRHFMVEDVKVWLTENYPSTWKILLDAQPKHHDVPNLKNQQDIVQTTNQQHSKSAQSTTSTSSNRQQDALWPLIDKARDGSPDPNNVSAVFAILVDMARGDKPPPPILGVTEDGIQYLNQKDELKYLNKAALNKRINPKARGKKKSTS